MNQQTEVSKPKAKTVRFPPDLYQALRREAFEADQSHNEYILGAVREKIERSRRARGAA